MARDIFTPGLVLVAESALAYEIIYLQVLTPVFLFYEDVWIRRFTVGHSTRTMDYKKV